MTKQEIKNLIKFTAGSFPNIQTKELTEIGNSWEEMLGAYPYQQIHEALRRVLRTARYWPAVAEILAAVDAIADERARQTFRPGERSGCPNCEGKGFIAIKQDGEERYARCPCVAGENYCGMPMAPGWAIVSDRKQVSTGEQLEEAIPF